MTEDLAPADAPSQEALLVVRRLLAAHEAWFDVERDCEVAGRRFAGHATFSEHGEKYVLSRRAKLWEVDSGEHLLFQPLAHLTSETLADYVAFMKGPALAALVHPAPNHMSTNVGLVLVADATDDDALRLARRVRFRKNHRLGIWGWTDLRLAVATLARPPAARDAVVTNAAGKTLRPTIQANLAPASAA